MSQMDEMDYTFNIPPLFPDTRAGGSPEANKAYVYRTFKGLVENGIQDSDGKTHPFCITACLLKIGELGQDQLAAQIVREIVFGHGPDFDGIEGNRSKYRTDLGEPEWLDDVKVRLERPDGQNIRWCDGMVHTPTRVGQKKGDRRYRDHGSSTGMFSVKEAILILDQCGYGVKPAPSNRCRNQWWKVREVNTILPWTDKTPEQKKTQEPK